MASNDNDAVVSLENVTHRFGRADALRDLSLVINRGDIYGLLGLNGAGKTTTIRILLGLLRPTAGRVNLFGLPRSAAWKEISDRIGATIEAPAFYPYLTGLANLELLHRLSGRRTTGRRPTEALEIVGLADAANVKTKKYSMGMLQRLYLAQALLCSPELLVLDEPTSNLDPKGIADVRRLIQTLNRDDGVTVLLSSHQLSEVEDLCNRVVIINKGRKLIESKVDDLFSSEESWVEIQVDRPAEAIGVLQELPWSSGTTQHNGCLKTRVPRLRRGELNALLVHRGFTVSELVERRPTLEDFFHERIAQDAA